jgi:predicted DCC family thiol-disulfide oxidoreductase YuxK
MNTPNKIIFFDGVCGLCNHFVDFIITRDHQKKFYFSPLQGQYAQELLPSELTQELKSIVYVSDGKVLMKSQAVIQIMQELGGIWQLAQVGKLLPLSFQNFFYDMVGSNRYRLFGKKETCRLPSAEERQRFIN